MIAKLTAFLSVYFKQVSKGFKTHSKRYILYLLLKWVKHKNIVLVLLTKADSKKTWEIKSKHTVGLILLDKNTVFVV